MTAIYPVILSGGSGTRLWPLSRSMYPKQFIRFFNGQSTSFLGATLRRLPAEAVSRRRCSCATTTIASWSRRSSRARESRRAPSSWSRSRAIRPPRSRSPPSSIAREDPNGVMVVMPSDHVDQGRRPSSSRPCAAPRTSPPTGRLVLFGIKPTEPHTGYGYIRQGDPIEGFNGGAFNVAFVRREARTARRPRSYLADGSYFWNSGIFVLHVRTFLDELARLEPRVLEAARGALARGHGRSGLPASRQGGIRRSAVDLRRLCRDGEDRRSPPCCRSTSAGTTSARGRRCGTSRRTTPTAIT